MAPSTCLVCSSPSANSLHFGAKSCKACAAFFRRTVSMNMKYACSNPGPGDEERCSIHFHLRMICRHCRYLKCIKAGMRREMVQRKLPNGTASHEATPEPAHTTTKRKMTDVMAETESKEERLHSQTKSERLELLEESPASHVSDPSSSILCPKEEEPSWSGSTSPLDMTAGPSSVADSTEARMSHQAELANVILNYRRSEMALQDRRRVLHGNCVIYDLFQKRTDCPFRREHLKEVDVSIYNGLGKGDLVCLLEQTRDLMCFEQLHDKDKSLFFRFVLAVDYVVGAAYLSEQLGKEEGLLVLIDARYIRMVPTPKTGFEEGAAAAFPDGKRHETYKLFMPLFVRHYTDVVTPIIEAKLSFTEFALFKALLIIHMVHFRVSKECRVLCERERNLIINAMYKAVEDEGIYDPAERVGGLILLMSSIMNFASHMIGHYFKIRLFELADIDPLIMSMCNFIF